MFGKGSAILSLAAMTVLAGTTLAEARFTMLDDAPPADPVSWTEGWKGTVEFGLNGSDGNSESLNFRAGTSAKRETSDYDTTASLVYSRAASDGVVTTNKAELNLRNDWKFKDSPWRVFALGKAEYDDFQAWEYRLSAFGGVGYEVIKDDTTFLLLRAGLGFSKELNSPENKITPEGLLGADFSYKVSERSKFTSSLDFYPSLDEFPDYRFNLKAAYEILVDPETKMSFKIGAEDRYDSDPGAGAKKNDIDYFALLVWSY